MNHFELYESYIPFTLLDWRNFLIASLALTGIVAFRYFLMAGSFWWVFYRWSPQKLRNRQIYKSLPSRSSQIFEIKYSFLSAGIFGVSGVLMGLLWELGWARFYLPFDQYGWWYLPISAFLLSFLHDFYFYLMHRLLHVPWFYRRFHSVHHESLTPSPWASFSFHPVESMLEAIPIPLIALFLPLHPVVVLSYLTVMTISAITNHLGFEVLPRGAASHALGRWFISGVHHTGHHRYFRYNYGLFYTWWDKWLGTEHPNYVKDFNEVVRS